MSDLIFTENGWKDYLWWQSNKKTLDKLNALLKDVLRHPFEGMGKPEPLKNEGGKWSRRITDKDRLIYEVRCGAVVVKQCRGHYDDK